MPGQVLASPSASSAVPGTILSESRYTGKATVAFQFVKARRGGVSCEKRRPGLSTLDGAQTICSVHFGKAQTICSSRFGSEKASIADSLRQVFPTVFSSQKTQHIDQQNDQQNGHPQRGHLSNLHRVRMSSKQQQTSFLLCPTTSAPFLDSSGGFRQAQARGHQRQGHGSTPGRNGGAVRPQFSSFI